MGVVTLLSLAVAVSMDAFAVSICKGLALQKIKLKQYALVGLWFGGFQALMPVIGYFLGGKFMDKISSFDHWVAAGLLAIIGINMIREALSKDEEKVDKSLDIKTMFMLAVATSIDALAVGISLSVFDINIWLSVLCIGVTTFMFSAAGLKIGSLFGTRHKSKAEFVGGAILIILGIKTVLEHTGVL
ncbi:MAG: manganese efflux pump [Bacteroidales bacterium]|nr:manganese efflux pump [Bacteroidales bacterium]